MPGSQDRSQTNRDRPLLRPADHAARFAALDQPPPSTSKLTTAVERHRRTVKSR